ncbi:SPOR domain-containing protein [Mucilaginibacter sp.]|uniref:SPOR domain-containing protein n=1 Tax=Mucilaginibacter sp. TaxID=1882438 RepID=UPI00260FF929|nr:SPOR domain-containing protein [Mucilaginibacter sp.]
MKNTPVYKANFSNIFRCIFFIAIFIPAISYAQDRGTVEVVKDPRIDTFMARRANLKSSMAAVYASSYGYRVQIYSGSSRKDAYDVQARFTDTYPGMRTYISYSEPNYKVHAGDFRTRLEAEKLKQELGRSFTSLFIIEEKINPPKADTQ